MMRQLVETLQWSWLDTWTAVTAGLAAMACAVPGVFLVVRRQSMMGDALSHTALPGIVVAYLIAATLRAGGWVGEEAYGGLLHALLFGAALLVGVFSAVAARWIQKIGDVESSAALGVVFTTLFAVGLLLVRLVADSIDIDPDCVLYGTVETTVLDTVAGTHVPRAAAVNGLALAFNLVLVAMFFKELRISAFDPALSTTLGFPAEWLHYGLMAVTAATLVAAFESVGSILVIAMLIVPPATAHLLTDRLGSMIVVSLLVAAASAGLGHTLAIGLPAVVFSRLGFDHVGAASTAGMTAVASGLLLCAAILLSPRHGLVSQLFHRLRLRLQIAAEDALGILYRYAENPERSQSYEAALPTRPFTPALVWLRWGGYVQRQAGAWSLTPAGIERAQSLVRSHRLWESYIAKHFELPDDHLHASAERVEHFIDRATRERLAVELHAPQRDPHGQAIPENRAE